MAPARDTCDKRTSREGEAQREVSRFRAKCLEILKPQLSTLGAEAEAFERDFKLRAPAVLLDAGPHIPNAVPLAVGEPALRDASIHQDARRVGREVVGIAVVVEGVQDQLDVVLAHEERIAGHLPGHDPVRLAVLAKDGHIEDILVVSNPNPGGFRGRFARPGLHLDEAADRRVAPPDAFTEHTVDTHRLGQHDGLRPASIAGREREPAQHDSRQE